MKAVFASIVAVAWLIGSVGTASAACSYGSFSPWTTSMNGSASSGFAECTRTNLGVTFKAKTYLRGTCRLGKGCKSASIVRSDSNCGYLGIGAQVRVNKVNYATGVITQDAHHITTPNSWFCNDERTQSEAAFDSWLLGARCRIGVGC